jgi:hypothetical protein
MLGGEVGEEEARKAKALALSAAAGGAPGTQFTTQFTCFTSTNVQILTPEELVVHCCCNCCCCSRRRPTLSFLSLLLSLPALIVQKYKY